MLTEKDVHVGEKVYFVLERKLFFSVVHNIPVGRVFSSLQTMSYLVEFDLDDFPDGLEVSLTQQPYGGKYEFAGRNVVLH